MTQDELLRKLGELVDKWNKRAIELALFEYWRGRADELHRCANELERLVRETKADEEGGGGRA